MDAGKSGSTLLLTHSRAPEYEGEEWDETVFRADLLDHALSVIRYSEGEQVEGFEEWVEIYYLLEEILGLWEDSDTKCPDANLARFKNLTTEQTIAIRQYWTAVDEWSDREDKAGELPLDGDDRKVSEEMVVEAKKIVALLSP